MWVAELDKINLLSRFLLGTKEIFATIDDVEEDEGLQVNEQKRNKQMPAGQNLTINE